MILEEFYTLFPPIVFWEELKDMGTSSRLKGNQHASMHEALIKEAKFSSISKNSLSGLQYWRLHVIDLFESLLGNKIFGNVLEIGSGKGVASAYISTFNSVDKITALDYSFPSLDDLLPLAHYEFKNADPLKVSRVYGSYLNIKESNYDFIFGFGAIHNAPDLELLFRSLYDSLSDGGYFVSSDMCEDFSVTVNEEDYLNSRPVPNAKERYGKDLTFADTSDFFRSPYDYLYYAKKAGFRVYPIIFNKDASKKLSNSFEMAFSCGSINSFFPSGCRGRADRLMLICHKEKINNSRVLDTPTVIYNDIFDKSNIKRLLKKLFSKFIFS